MSSLRNAVKRVAHKERAQPASRKRFGLLEKHKDYVQRANDFKKKKKNIKILKEKAANRNPDEFYFKMHKSKVKDGVHTDDLGTASLDTSTVKLLKTQDLGYVIQKKAVDDRKIEKLKSTLHGIGNGKAKKHTIFVNEANDVKDFDPVEHFDTVPEFSNRSFNRVRRSALEKQALAAAEEPAESSAGSHERASKQLKRSYKELAEREARAKKLGVVAEKLSLQRNLLGKGSKRKLTAPDGEGGEKVVYKWKRERSR
jgi:U3 small nucleolar RNA-associated protein 11